MGNDKMLKYMRCILNDRLVLYSSPPMTLLHAGHYEHGLSCLRDSTDNKHRNAHVPSINTHGEQEAHHVAHAAFFDFFFLSVVLDEDAGAAAGAGSAFDFLLFFSGDFGVSTLAGVAS